MERNCKTILLIAVAVFIFLGVSDAFNEGATNIDGSPADRYGMASEFVRANTPSEIVDDANFIYATKHIEYPHVSRSSKIKYYDLRAPPVIPKDDLYFNDSPYEIPVGVGRKSIDI